MAKRILTLAVCFTLFILGNVLADLEPLQKHSWELGTQVSYITYKEPNVMEEKGVMSGILGSYAYQDGFMLKAEGLFSYGQLDYTSSSTGSMDNIDDYILEFRGVVGYNLPILQTYTLTPYMGFGYRYLNDDTSGMLTTTGARGYERESNYFYSPVGLELGTNFNNSWSAGITFEYDYFWKGIQKSHLSDVSLGYNDLENDQNKGYGLRGSVKLTKKGNRFDFVIEPFIRYWNIKKSEEKNVTFSGVIIGYGYEPKNTSTEFGINLAARF